MVAESALKEFRTSLRGECLLAGESGYDEPRKIHNAMMDRCPAMIVRCAGVADVIDAVRFARAHDMWCRSVGPATMLLSGGQHAAQRFGGGRIQAVRLPGERFGFGQEIPEL